MTWEEKAGRRGPASVLVDEEFRNLLSRYVENQVKLSTAAAQLGISQSTLNRLLSGRSLYIARSTYARIISAVGSPTSPFTPPNKSRGDQSAFQQIIGQAMQLDARGDHLAAASELARISEAELDPVQRIGFRYARARNALARGDTETAEYLLQGLVSILKGRREKVTLARIATELAMVSAQRQKVTEALLAFHAAEQALLESGPDGVPFLALVRQAFLSYALRIGKTDEARRLLMEGIQMCERVDGAGSLSAQFDGWLLQQIASRETRPPGSVLDKPDES